jgi:hypothetical protein
MKINLYLKSFNSALKQSPSHMTTFRHYFQITDIANYQGGTPPP